ncbi:MAG: multidrug resistance protein [Armatimonadota bacterium]|nr:MAG: multidrug resistance protein [Armatimonadota bacterium]
MPTLLLVFIAVVLASFGQIAMKHGMNLTGSLGPSPGVTILFGLLKAVFTPYVFLGLALYAISAMFWLMVLKQAQELSYVYPLIGSTYVIVLLLSWLFFKEHITLVRSVGVVLICLGVVFVARS